MTIRIRLKPNATWKQKQAAWLARRRGYQRTIKALRQQLARREEWINDLVGEYEFERARRQAEHEQRHREQVQNWNLYDKAYAETTQQELDLFQASPAFKKYQQWRQSK